MQASQEERVKKLKRRDGGVLNVPQYWTSVVEARTIGEERRGDEITESKLISKRET